MQLRTVVRVRRRVVAPEVVAGREVMLERHYTATAEALSSIIVLVSRAVPVEKRGAVALRILRAHGAAVLGNDGGSVAFDVQEVSAPSVRGGQGPL